jgi:hypothetical protein
MPVNVCLSFADYERIPSGSAPLRSIDCTSLRRTGVGQAASRGKDSCGIWAEQRVERTHTVSSAKGILGQDHAKNQHQNNAADHNCRRDSYF